MAETSVRIMQCAVASTGLLRIDRIGVGIGIILYSAFHKTGAGVHILAPSSGTPTPENPAKYADTAVHYVLDQLKKKGVKPPFSVAIAGGGTMLQSVASMGPRNVEAVKDVLKKAHLSVKHDQTGGSGIRSMVLDVETGKINIT